MKIANIVKKYLPKFYDKGADIYRKRICCSGIRIEFIQKHIEGKLFLKKCDGKAEKIPIYILSYNRLSYLEKIISYLENKNLRNIIIIDNASTYPPLLEYYTTLKYPIIKMDQNYGHSVFFEHRYFRRIRWFSHYVYTDPDVLPILDCPSDFMSVFYDYLRLHKTIYKIGFSLKIDDIPDDYEYKSEVISWESRFYDCDISTDGIPLYDAPIDTTFALYRPKIFAPRNFYSALRTGFPYQARHLPWYKRRDDLTDEDKYYIASTVKTTGNWNYDMDKETLKERYDL